jgi:hypothetical protein
MYATLHKKTVKGKEVVTHVEVFNSKDSDKEVQSLFLFPVKDVSGEEMLSRMAKVEGLEQEMLKVQQELGLYEPLPRNHPLMKECTQHKRYISRRHKYAHYSFEGGIAYSKGALKRKAIVHVMKNKA